MKKTFILNSQGQYLNNKITILGRFPHYFNEAQEIVFYHFSGRGGYSVPAESFKRLYIKSNNNVSVLEYDCLGVYESLRRMRVVPFLSHPAPQGDEEFVAFYELMSGRVYSVSRLEFLSNFKCEVAYKNHAI